MKGGRKLLLFAGGVGSVGAVGYAGADSTQRRKARVAVEGIVRFLRSVSVGLAISLDYWWAGRGLDEVSALCTESKLKLLMWCRRVRSMM